MPPPTPLSTPSSTSVTLAISPPILRSAARDVYYIPELRQRILQLLAKEELANFIRVNKACFSSVVEELYRAIPYDSPIQFPQSVSPERLETYEAAVRTIEADSQYTSSDLDQGALRRRFVNLRQVTVTVRPDHWWSVYLHAVRPPTDTNPFADIDRVEYFNRTAFEAYPLPMTADFIPKSSPNFTIMNWYNIHIYPAPLSVAHGMMDSWRQAFKNASWVSELGSSINFGNLPITFDDVIGLCNRQTADGHGVRLRDVTASHMTPWSLHQFEAFARVASGSLQSLRLIDVCNASYNAAVTFDNLSAIVATIKTHLPHLERFEAPMTEHERAEDACGKTLSHTSLNSCGSVKVLHIYIDEKTVEFHNIIRCLYGMCALKAEVTVGTPLNEDGLEWEFVDDYSVNRWGAADFLEYFQKQSIERRKHLSTADFPALGVTRPGDERSLRHHTTGAPKALWRSKVRGWENGFRVAGGPAKQLESKLGALSAMAGRVRKNGRGTESGPPTLAEAEVMLEALRSAKKNVAEIERHLDCELDVVQFVAQLRKVE